VPREGEGRMGKGKEEEKGMDEKGRGWKVFASVKIKSWVWSCLLWMLPSL